ncbi:MAG: O-antigen ligase family protein [Acidobacteriota bacterium]
MRIDLGKTAFGFLVLGVFFIPPELMALPIPGLGSMARIVLALCLVFTLMYMLNTRRIGSDSMGNHSYLFACVFFYWEAMTLLWSKHLSASLQVLFSMFQLNLFFLIIITLIRSKERLNSVLQAYVWGNVICSVSLFNSLLAGTTFKGRYTAGLYDPNDMALTMALAVPMAWELYRMDTRFKWLYLLCIPLFAACIVLSGSRGGFAVLTCALIYIAFSFFRSNQVSLRKIIGLAAVLLICGYFIASSYIPSSVWESQWQRITTLFSEEGRGTLSNRTEIWAKAIEVFKQHSIFGTGLGTFTFQASRMSIGPHNYYLAILVEQGLIGIAFYTIFYLTILKNLLTRFRKEPDLYLYLCIFLLFSIGVMTLGWETRKTPWLIYGLCTAAVLVQDRKASDHARLAGSTSDSDKHWGSGKNYYA